MSFKDLSSKTPLPANDKVKPAPVTPEAVTPEPGKAQDGGAP